MFDIATLIEILYSSCKTYVLCFAHIECQEPHTFLGRSTTVIGSDAKKPFIFTFSHKYNIKNLTFFIARINPEH